MGGEPLYCPQKRCCGSHSLRPAHPVEIKWLEGINIGNAGKE